MFKTRKWATLLLALTMVCLTACGSSDSSPAGAPAAENGNSASATDSEGGLESKGSGEQLRIGLSLPTQQNERWVRDGEGMQQKCDELGIELMIQSANNDPATQIKQCENLLASNIDLLIVGPCDSTAAAPIVDKAHEAGIPILSYCRLILNSEVDYYIGEDSIMVGTMQGQFLLDNCPTGNYILLSGDPADNLAGQFYQGAMEVLQPAIDSGAIKVVADQPVIGWDQQYALQLVENALTANDNDIQAILCPADSTANGVVEALATQGLDGKVLVTGQDGDLLAAQRIVQGTQSMTVFKDTRDLSALAIEIAYKVMKGESVEAPQTQNNGNVDVPTWLTDPVLVTKDNIDAALIDSGYLTKEEIYG